MKCSILLTLIWSTTLLGAAPLKPRPLAFGFRAMEIYKFEFGTRHLKVLDIDGDGLDDAAFVNNRESRMEILIRKPGSRKPEQGLPLLDEYYRNRGMIVDQQIMHYLIEDFNGDRKPDLVTFGGQLGLRIRMQKAAAEFAAPRNLYLRDMQDVVTIKSADFNNDDRPDLAVCRRNLIEILWNDAKSTFKKRKRVFFSRENAQNCEFCDIDRDGLIDLILYQQNPQTPIIVRLGKGDGLFGMEHSLELPPMRYLRLMNGAPAKEPYLAAVLQNGLGFRLYEFTMIANEPLLDSREIMPQRIPLIGSSRKSSPPWTLLRADEDEFPDLLAAAPERSQLHLYHGSKAGLEPEYTEIDTLSDIHSVRVTSGGDVLVISRREKAAALHRRQDLKKFPVMLNTPGEVLAGDVVTTNLYLLCRKDSAFKLVHGDFAGKPMNALDLDMRNEPEDMRAFSLGEDGIGLLFFMPYAQPLMFVLHKGELSPLKPSAFRALSMNLTPNQLRFVKPDSGRDLIISQGKTARHYRWNDGAYKVVRQFTPDNERAEIVTTCNYTAPDGRAGVLLYDKNGEELLWCNPDDNGHPVRIHLKTVSGAIDGMVQLKTGDQSALALITRQDILLYSNHGSDLQLTARAEYMSPSEEPSLRYNKPVELGHPSKPMIAIVDVANRAVELIDENEQGLYDTLIFEVYQETAFSSEDHHQLEPHDITSGDVDGDGHGDLLVLVHDRLLIYLGE